MNEFLTLFFAYDVFMEYFSILVSDISCIHGVLFYTGIRHFSISNQICGESGALFKWSCIKRSICQIFIDILHQMLD